MPKPRIPYSRRAAVLAASTLSLLLWVPAGCSSDGSAAEDDDAFLPASPSAEEVSDALDALRESLEAALPTQTRDQLEVGAAALAMGQGLLLTELEPSPLAWARLGLATHMYGAVSAAIWCNLRALEGAPEHPALLSQLGFELNSQGRYVEAKPFLLRAVELEPELGPALANLAYTFWQLERRDRAAHYYSRAIAAQPMAADWLLQLGQVYAEDGDVNAARAAFEEALAITPGDPETTGWLASLPAPAPGSPPPSEGLIEVAEIISECGLAQAEDFTTIVAPRSDALRTTESEYTVAMASFDRALQTCENDCTPAQGLQCITDCLGARCGSAKGQVARSVPEHLDRVIGVNSAFHLVHSRFQACVRGRVAALPDVSESVHRYVDTTLRIQAGVVHETNRDQMATHLDIAEMWNLEANSICATAQMAHDALPTAQEATRQFTSELCLILICINFDNGEIGLSVMLGFVAAELTIDTINHSFSAGVGVGVAIPHIASAVVMVKVDTKKGVGINRQAKLGGVMSAKHSKDYWLTTNRALGP